MKLDLWPIEVDALLAYHKRRSEGDLQSDDLNGERMHNMRRTEIERLRDAKSVQTEELTQWIPVTERLPVAVYAGTTPAQSEDVLVQFNQDGDEPHQAVACYWHDDKRWDCEGDWTFFEYSTVTHWMPLPAIVSPLERRSEPK